MGTYFTLTKLIGNTIKDPLFTEALPGWHYMDKESKKAIRKDKYGFNQIGLGHSRYYEVYLMARNFIHLISYFENYPTEKIETPIAEGLGFLRPTFNFMLRFSSVRWSDDPEAFQYAKGLIAKKVYYFYKLKWDITCESGRLQFKYLEEIEAGILKCKNYNEIIIELSSSNLIDLYDVISLIKEGIFEEYEFGCLHSKYDRELEAAIVIAILERTHQITNFNIFKNEK